MTTRTINRINQLSAERMQLYQEAASGGRTDGLTVIRIRHVSDELEALWEERRRERAGRLEGIDLVVHRAYEQTYGPRYEDAISPPTVGEPGDDATKIAA